MNRILGDVQANIPKARSSVQHGSNRRFSWWIVARLSNRVGAVIDFSIDAREDAADLLVTIDLARVDGFVLAELPRLRIRRELNGSESRRV
jgi:hypothetical protein